jgi:hypothetical protein
MVTEQPKWWQMIAVATAAVKAGSAFRAQPAAIPVGTTIASRPSRS